MMMMATRGLMGMVMTMYVWRDGRRPPLPVITLMVEVVVAMAARMVGTQT